ncbi:hypothetical protein GHT06_016064 [Daphnia sinensis]|uniref:Peptidase S1 domain-containing protein n=1 Tax=Daphnia sinensis TaxID=1820382 RepID=A0AAD5PXT6_9CRUS|nr:hypothetical protein GHT06_016064 [Daphnia sinensis]
MTNEKSFGFVGKRGQWPLREVIKCVALAIIDDHHSSNKHLFVVKDHDLRNHKFGFLNVFGFETSQQLTGFKLTDAWVACHVLRDRWLPKLRIKTQLGIAIARIQIKRRRSNTSVNCGSPTLPSGIFEIPGNEVPTVSIIGGTVAIAGEFPYMAHLVNGGACGGTLISETIVVTAAHCTPSNSSADLSNFYVYLNTLTFYGEEEGSIVRKVKSFHRHENYTGVSVYFHVIHVDVR